jgi:hypothetical protein
MSKLRLFFLASLALIAGMLDPASAARAADVKCLPDDTEFVIGVQLKQIGRSELVTGEKGAIDQLRTMLNQIVGHLPIFKCLHDAGCDSFRDLTRVSFAGSRNQDLKIGFLVLEGDFQSLKLSDKLAEIAKANPSKLKINPAGGTTIYEIGTPIEKCHYAAFVNANTLLAAATREALADALARSSGSKKSALAKPFQTLLEAGNDSESIRIVATGPMLSLLMSTVKATNGETAVAALKTLDAASGSITIDKAIRFEVGIFARDAATAKQLADASANSITTLRGLVQQKAKEDEKLLPAVDIVKTLEITSRDSIILLHGQANLNAIENLMKNRPNIQTSRDPSRSGR